jgi:hypothetical protein
MDRRSPAHRLREPTEPAGGRLRAGQRWRRRRSSPAASSLSARWQSHLPALAAIVAAVRQWPAERALVLALFVGATWGFVAAFTRQYSFDAVAYAYQIEQFHTGRQLNWLLHPHHLLYNPIAYLWWRAVHAVPGFARPLEAQQMLSALSGGAGVALAYLAARKATGNAMLATGVALLLWATFGLWSVATDGLIYALGLAACVAVVATAMALLDAPRWPLALVLGLLGAGAALVHQMHLLLLPALAVTPVLAGRTRREQARLWLIAGGSYLFALASAYALAAAVRGFNSIGAVGEWLTAYGQDGRWWNWELARNLRLDVVALARAASAEPQAMLAFGERWYGPLLGLLLVGGGVLLLAGCRTRSRQLLFCAVWLLPYAAFFTFWVPGYYLFWVPILFGLLLLGGIVAEGALRCLRSTRISEGAGRLLRGVMLAICLVTAWRLASANRPFLERRQGVGSAQVEIVEEIARQTQGYAGPDRSSDLLLTTGVGPYAYLETYVPYFARRNLVTLAHALKHHGPGCGRSCADAAAWLQARIRRSWERGAEVYLLPDMRDRPAALAILRERYGMTPGDLDALLREFRVEPAFDLRGAIVYRLRPDGERDAARVARPHPPAPSPDNRRGGV